VVLLIHISDQELSPEPCGSFSRLIPIELAILAGDFSDLLCFFTCFTLSLCIAAHTVCFYQQYEKQQSSDVCELFYETNKHRISTGEIRGDRDPSTNSYVVTVQTAHPPSELLPYVLIFSSFISCALASCPHFR
jgi:hypothetical protein